jgi:hypothetical protein
MWITGSLALSIADDVNGSIEMSQRFRNSGDQQQLRASAEFRLFPAVSVTGGASYVRSSASTEYRPDQQMTVFAGPVSFRSMIEERLIDGADRVELRVRERVRLAVPLGTATRIAGAAELLYIAQPRNRAAQARIDSWRGSLAIQRRLSGHLDATVGYLLIYSPRAGSPDRISHVPQLSLTLRP